MEKIRCTDFMMSTFKILGVLYVHIHSNNDCIVRKRPRNCLQTLMHVLLYIPESGVTAHRSGKSLS